MDVLIENSSIRARDVTSYINIFISIKYAGELAEKVLLATQNENTAYTHTITHTTIALCSPAELESFSFFHL